MTMYSRITFNQNGTMVVSPIGLNQPVQGNGTYQVPPGFGNAVKRISMVSDAGAQNVLWSVNWFTPWLGNPLGGV